MRQNRIQAATGGFEITIKAAVFIWQNSFHGYGGIVRYCYVCFLFHGFGYGELSKKFCLVEWDFLPMSMNTHII